MSVRARTTGVVKTIDEIMADAQAAVPAVAAEVTAFDPLVAVELAWPVGSIHINTTGADPHTTLGVGVWTAFGAGRVLVGFDAGDPSFNVAEAVGGAKSVASSGAVAAPVFTGAALGTHSHSVTSNVSVAAHSSNVVGISIGGDVDVIDDGNHGVDNPAVTSSSDSAGTPAGTNSAPAYSGTATSVVQPYIVVYFWKRTA